MVFRGLVTIWSLATPPTSHSPRSERATTLGRMRLPLSVGTTRGMRLRTWATQVLVVPRSMPRMGLSRVSGGGIGDDGSTARLEGNVLAALLLLAGGEQARHGHGRKGRAALGPRTEGRRPGRLV